MAKKDPELLKRLQKVADQPETFQDALARMNALYETNSYPNSVPPEQDEEELLRQMYEEEVRKEQEQKKG